jgi:glycosyl transferase family 25
MEKQGEAFGIPLERFSAVDGHFLDATAADGFSLGALGCFHSHRAVWAEVAEGIDDFVFVLEDDVHFMPDLAVFLRDLSWIPSDTDIVHVEYFVQRFRAARHSISAHGRRLWRLIDGAGGTGAYIISRDCARRLRETLTMIDREFDQILFNGGRPDLRIYKLNPALCRQDIYNRDPRFPSLLRDWKQLPKATLTYNQKLKREATRISRQVMHVMSKIENTIPLKPTRYVWPTYL